jgi:hypothetical protein
MKGLARLRFVQIGHFDALLRVWLSNGRVTASIYLRGFAPWSEHR